MQAVQASLPTSSEDDPAGHFEQVDAPEPPWDHVAGQGVHVVCQLVRRPLESTSLPRGPPPL
jgi:hypothetical protein